MIPRVGPEGMLFGKPASTPDQVRGRLFPDHALGAGALDLVFGSAGGEQFHRLRAVEFPDAQLFVETNEAFENSGCLEAQLVICIG